jgi:hypothetical protein
MRLAMVGSWMLNYHITVPKITVPKSGPVILSVAKDQQPVLDSSCCGNNVPLTHIIPNIEGPRLPTCLRYAQDDRGSMVP